MTATPPERWTYRGGWAHYTASAVHYHYRAQQVARRGRKARCEKFWWNATPGIAPTSGP
jgi:hypothetical protein